MRHMLFLESALDVLTLLGLCRTSRALQITEGSELLKNPTFERRAEGWLLRGAVPEPDLRHADRASVRLDGVEPGSESWSHGVSPSARRPRIANSALTARSESTPRGSWRLSMCSAMRSRTPKRRACQKAEAITMLRGRCGVRGSTLALATLLALFAGCVRTDLRGGETVYRYEPVVWIALLAGGGGLPLLSLWAYRKLSDSPRLQQFAFLGMIMPPLAALGFVPKMVSDQIRVDDNGFVSVSGSLVERKTQAVRFDQLAQIQVQTETYTETSRRGRQRERQRQVLVFIRKDGTSEKFYPDTLIKEAAPDLLARAEAKGVGIVDVEEQARRINEEKKTKDMMKVIRLLKLDQPRRSPNTKGTASQTAEETPKSTEDRRPPNP